MRSIRKYHATEWVKIFYEYEVMNWQPPPPNPLQHTTIKTTLTKYAEKGIDNKWEARKRCVEKYKDIKNLYQSWMEDWVKI